MACEFACAPTTGSETPSSGPTTASPLLLVTMLLWAPASAAPAAALALAIPMGPLPPPIGLYPGLRVADAGSTAAGSGIPAPRGEPSATDVPVQGLSGAVGAAAVTTPPPPSPPPPEPDSPIKSPLAPLLLTESM